jgi:hypothetical protein
MNKIKGLTLALVPTFILSPLQRSFFARRYDSCSHRLRSSRPLARLAHHGTKAIPMATLRRRRIHFSTSQST